MKLLKQLAASALLFAAIHTQFVHAQTETGVVDTDVPAVTPSETPTETPSVTSTPSEDPTTASPSETPVVTHVRISKDRNVARIPTKLPLEPPNLSPRPTPATTRALEPKHPSSDHKNKESDIEPRGGKSLRGNL